MKKRTHYILLFCMLALSAVCGILIPKVNVNSDMTRYLPDDSQMKQGMLLFLANGETLENSQRVWHW